MCRVGVLGVKPAPLQLLPAMCTTRFVASLPLWTAQEPFCCVTYQFDHVWVCIRQRTKLPSDASVVDQDVDVVLLLDDLDTNTSQRLGHSQQLVYQGKQLLFRGPWPSFVAAGFSPRVGQTCGRSCSLNPQRMRTRCSWSSQGDKAPTAAYPAA